MAHVDPRLAGAPTAGDSWSITPFSRIDKAAEVEKVVDMRPVFQLRRGRQQSRMIGRPTHAFA
jgi:hypothetical protein